MPIDTYQLVFPKRYTSADARAWGSLYGFEHERATRSPSGRLTITQRPRSDFHGPLRERMLANGVTALVGKAPLRTPSTAYDVRNAQLRKYALRTRAASATPNRDLVDWYNRWVVRTHPDMTDDEHAVARAITGRLLILERQHALAYIRKLRASPLN